MKKRIAALSPDAFAAIWLILAALTAFVISNTAFNSEYKLVFDLPISVTIGDFYLKKSLLIWINDGLMAIFFFLIGLELKKEFLEGNLSKPSQVVLPMSGAVGGVVVPSVIFYCLNAHDEIGIRGWAIPAATDIAFALGVLALCAKKVPPMARVFLSTLAIIDDLAAILIIAFFYTEDISIFALSAGAFGLLTLLALNRFQIQKMAPYLLVGIFLWVCVVKSGVHATLAGVATAFFIPLNDGYKKMEHDLHPWVMFAILPIFAFANSGVEVDKLLDHGLQNSVTIGTALGLFFGKQLGIFLFATFALVVFKIKTSKDLNYLTIYGLSLLGGIGFTMSLFIASLAYENANEYLIQARAGILAGSILSAFVGYAVLNYAFAPQPRVRRKALKHLKKAKARKR